MNCPPAVWKTAVRSASWSRLRLYLAQKQPSALLSARSRFQSETRAQLNTVEDSGDYVKVNPLAHLSREDLEAYAKERDLPVNPLYWQGFLSIGCAPDDAGCA